MLLHVAKYNGETSIEKKGLNYKGEVKGCITADSLGTNPEWSS